MDLKLIDPELMW